jgi:HAE1 family hydrophobic/amphiphilic exporter-1
MMNGDSSSGSNGAPFRKGAVVSSRPALHSFKLSDFSIQNPVFAVMLSAAMIVFGYLGYQELGISQFPELDFPVVSITTYLDAAAPETADVDITDVIEDAVAGVEGIDYVQSQSSQGVSVTTVFFHLHRDVDVAMQDVQNAVAAAANRLPNDIDPPIISKVNFNKFPVLWLSVHGNRPIQDLNQFVDDYLKQAVQTIPGVGGVMYGGLRPRTMRLWLDKTKLQSFGLDAFDVWQALRAEHVEKPAGYLQGETVELNVRTMGEARTATEFRRLPVASRGGQVIRMEDVAVVEDGLADRRTFARFNRMPNVGVGVMRATGANVVAVCDAVKERLPELRRLAPPETQISISTDYSMFIKEDIAEVKQALFMGVVLTAIVTFLFLGSLGTTLNVCVSIPTSLVGTFIVMRWMGFTVNFMTLLALSLSVGVVVDDAILVLENIYRRREHGNSKRDAALFGAREISFAALASTLSIVAIFFPVAFMKGAIGRFFFQFGITVSVAVLLSLVVSLTITPMLCSLFLNVRPPRRPRPATLSGLLGPPISWYRNVIWWVDRWILEPVLLWPMNALMHGLNRVYSTALRVALAHQRLVALSGVLLGLAALVFAFGISISLPFGMPALVIKPVGRELVPSEDQNRFVVNVICPVGSSIDYVDDMLRIGENVLGGLKDPVTGREVVATFFASVSIRPGSLISEGILFVRLIPPIDTDGAVLRTMHQSQIMAAVRNGFANVAGVKIIALDLSTQGFTATRGYPVNFAVQGPDWDTVTRLSERIADRMSSSGVVTDVNSDYRPGMPEVQITPDRAKCATLNVSVRRVAFALGIGVGGFRNGRFTDGDRRYDIRLRYLEGQRTSPDQTDDLYVRNERGALVPLRDVTTRKIVSTLPVINRYNHLRKVELTANMAPGVSQGEAIARSNDMADKVREEMGLPPSYRIVQLGNAQAMQQTLESLWACLALGFVVAAMILGVQFNSFVHPFTVLLAVPFGVTGALATLWLLGDTLNMMSMIGMILLAGLVKKNSIVLVDFMNRVRAEGMSLHEAVLHACPVRLRPIVMTTLATVAGAVPLALGLGPGSETRAPLARSIIGGSLLSTAVTLIIVPIFYVLFDRFGAWVMTLSRREPSAEAAAVAIPEPAHNGHAAAPEPQPKLVIEYRGE